MRRRSNWPLVAIFLAVAAIQTAVNALSRTETTASPEGVKEPGTVCTTCGPIPVGPSLGANSLEQAPFVKDLPAATD